MSADGIVWGRTDEWMRALLCRPGVREAGCREVAGDKKKFRMRAHSELQDRIGCRPGFPRRSPVVRGAPASFCRASVSRPPTVLFSTLLGLDALGGTYI